MQENSAADFFPLSFLFAVAEICLSRKSGKDTGNFCWNQDQKEQSIWKRRVDSKDKNKRIVKILKL